MLRSQNLRSQRVGLREQATQQAVRGFFSVWHSACCERENKRIAELAALRTNGESASCFVTGLKRDLDARQTELVSRPVTA